MEKMKKILSFTLSVLMTMSAVVSVSPGVFADENEIPIEIPAASYTLENILNQSVKELNIHDTVNFTPSTNVQNVTFYFVESNYSGESLDSAEKITLSENDSFDVPQKSSDSDKAVSAKSSWTIAKAINEDGSAKVILVSDIPNQEIITSINEIPDLPDNIKNTQLEIGEKFPSLAKAESEFDKDAVVANNDKTGLFSLVKLYWFQLGDETEEGKFVDAEQDTVKEGKKYAIVMGLVADQTKATISISRKFTAGNWEGFATYSNMIFTVYNTDFRGISNPYITELNCTLTPDAENEDYIIDGLPELTEEEINNGVKYCYLYVDNAIDLDAAVNDKIGKMKANQFPFIEDYLIDVKNGDTISIAEDDQGNIYNKVLIIKCCPTTSIYGEGWFDTLAMKGVVLGSESESGNVVSSISGFSDFNFDSLEEQFRVGKTLPSLTSYNNQIAKKVTDNEISINGEEQSGLIRRMGFVWYKEYADGTTEIVEPDDVVEAGIKYKIALGVSFNAQKCSTDEDITISDGDDKWTHLKKSYLDTYFSYSKDFSGEAVQKLNGVTLTSDETKKSYTVSGLPELEDETNKYVYYVRTLDDIGENAEADKFIQQSESMLIGYDIKGTAVDSQYLTEVKNGSTIIVPDRSVIGIFEIDENNLIHSATFEKAGVTYIDEMGDVVFHMPVSLKAGDNFPKLDIIDPAGIKVKKNGKEFENFVKSVKLKWVKVNDDNTYTDVDTEKEKVEEGATYKIVLEVTTDSDKCVFAKNVKSPENFTTAKSENAGDTAEFTADATYSGVSLITSIDEISDSELKNLMVFAGQPMPELPEISVEDITVNGGKKGAVTSAKLTWLKVNNDGALENIIDRDYTAEQGVQYKIGLDVSCSDNCSFDIYTAITSPEHVWKIVSDDSITDYVYAKVFTAEKSEIGVIDEISTSNIEGVKLTAGKEFPQLPQVDVDEITVNGGYEGYVKSAELKWYKQDASGKLVAVNTQKEKVAEDTVYKIGVILKGSFNTEFTSDCKVILPKNIWVKASKNPEISFVYNKEFKLAKKITVDNVKTIKVNAVSENAVSFSWSKVNGANGYQVWLYKDGKWKHVKTVSGTSYKISGLASGKSYAVKVRAYKKVSGKVYYGNYCASAKFTTKVTVGKVTTVKMTAVSNNAVKYKWSKVSGANGYQVWLGVNGKWKHVKTVSGTNYRIGGLANAKNYAVRVRAYKKIGSKIYYGSFSGTQIFTTRPLKPSKVAAASKAKKSISVAFTNSTRASGYQVQITSSGNLKGGIIFTTAKNKLAYSKLKSGRTYYVRVRAYKKLGTKKYFSGWTTAKKIKVK